MAFISFNNKNTTSSQLTDSEAAYHGWTTDHAKNDGVYLSDVETQYLSDHDAYQSASIQFYGSAVSSLAVWLYNIYDVRKKRHNYTDIQQNSRFGFSFTPDNQAVFHIKF